ncbi:uncharacterized protein [Centruroides vittatus]|uniref:uncharacterized protein n=1 Tax=Centruroides vittatus TaxID=120091 RepID=UPI00350F7C26
MDSKHPKQAEMKQTTKEKTPSQPAYLIGHATGEKPLAKYSSFLIQKLFESTIGHLKQIQKLRSGDLLVETASLQQTTKLLTMSTLGDMGISVTPHGSLNSSRGVISEFDLMSEDESDIHISLSDQGVTFVRRISIRRDGKLIPTKHLKFSHSTTRHCHPLLQQDICAAQFVCIFQIRCVSLNASDLDIPRPPVEAKAYVHSVELKVMTVPNVKVPHPAYSRKCPAWQREKETQRVKTINNLPYPEARRMVTSSAPFKQKTFAAVLKSTKTCGVQTDISVSPKDFLTAMRNVY